MLTPDYLTHVSEGAEAIAARLHTDVTKRITRRIVARQNRGDDYLLTSADKWQIETLMDAGYLRDDIMKDIANATGLQLSEIRDAFEDAGIKSTGYDDRAYKAAGLDPLPFKQSPYMQRLMQRNYEATAGLWQNYTGTFADAAQQTFVNAMDDIYTKVASGSMSYTQAYQEAIDDLAANGVDLLTEKGQKYVLYKSGHRDTIETAALRCVRTGVSQMAAQVTEARMDEMGVDLVIVSSHMGARPDHAVWQGGIYSRSGLDKKYPNFRESTGYGTGAGLCGWNCRHQFSPYFEGMDNPFPEIDEEENAEAYELTQQQRKMERTIRKTKRMAEVYADTAQAETDPAEKERYQSAADRAKELLKRQMEGYSTFCDKNDLRPLPERLRIARASRATGNTNLTKIETQKHEEDKTQQNIPQNAPKPIKKLKDSAPMLWKKLDKQAKAEYSDMVDYNPSPQIPAMYERYYPKLTKVVKKKGGGKFCGADDSIEIDYREGWKGISRYETIAHESGHAFDKYIVQDLPSLTFREQEAIREAYRRTFSYNSTLPDVFFGKVASRSDQFLEAVRQDRAAILGKYNNGEFLGDLLDMRDHHASNGVQDFLDGIIGREQLPTDWGRGNAYYNRKWAHTTHSNPNLAFAYADVYADLGVIPTSDTALAKQEMRIYDSSSELWANIAAAVTTGGEAFTYVAKYCPHSLRAFLTITGGIL